MKVRLHLTFEPVDVVADLPSDNMTEEEIIDYVNENWSEMIDPSLPPIRGVEWDLEITKEIV